MLKIVALGSPGCGGMPQEGSAKEAELQGATWSRDSDSDSMSQSHSSASGP